MTARRVRTALVLAAIAAAAFAVRASNRGAVFTPEGVVPVGVDGYYHARRTELAVRTWPRVIEYDGWVDVPDGGWLQWPPGHDWLLAGLARLFEGPDATRDEILGVAARTTPVLGALAAVLVFFVARRLFDPGRPETADRAGLVAAGALALLPAHRFVSGLGDLDHHVVEPLFSLAGYLAALALARTRSAAGAAALAALGGAVIAGSFYFWTGSLMYWAPLVLWVGLVQLGGYLRGESDARFDARALALFAWAAALMVPVVRSSPWGRDGTVDFTVLSAFHLFAIAAAAAAIVVFPLLRVLSRVLRIPRLWVLGGALVAIAGGVLWALSKGGTLGEILRGVADFLGGGGAQVLSAAESRPLLAGDWRRGGRLLTGVLYLAPALAAYAFAHRDRRRGAEWAFLAAWLAVMGTLGLLQRRFTPALGVALSALAAAAVAIAWERRREAARAARAGAWAILVFTAAALVPAFATIRPTTIPGGLWEFERLAPTLDWIRDTTPPAGLYHRPEIAPAYAVAANWNFGHWILVRAERPVVGSPFGLTPWNTEATVRTFEIMTAPDEESALARLAEARARYYLATPLGPYATMLGRVAASLGRPGTEAFGRWLNSRLLGEGAGADFATLWPFAHFRLVYESAETYRSPSGRPERAYEGSYARVFEIVPGARVGGPCPPGAPVALDVDVPTNRGRTLRWRRESACGADGRFETVVPYPSPGARVTAGERTEILEIPEQAVTEGHRVLLSPPLVREPAIGDHGGIPPERSADR